MEYDPNNYGSDPRAHQETGMRRWLGRAPYTNVRACRCIVFFSSRRRHTRCSRDWSSDVCSSDLIVDAGEFDEYRAEYGETLLCGYARVGGWAVGLVANQKKHVQTQARGSDQKRMEFGGVIYTESAEKAARFIMDCNQNRIPLVFLHDVNGFMVGKDAEWSGIIRAGAKMVNAVANSVVPKIAVICGGSFGAGHYAMCGKAYEPRFILDRKSTRLNSSHGYISYAVFCLKKKKYANTNLVSS